MRATGLPAPMRRRRSPQRRACRGTVTVRDRVVLCVLVVGIFLGLLAWAPLGPWAALLPILVALLVASFAYRVEPPRIDLDGPLPPLGSEEDAVASSSSGVSRRRRSAGRP